MTSLNPLSELQTALGHSFATVSLLDRALVHRSWAHDQNPSVPDNERLEFLGDAVLGLIIAEYFVREFPDVAEGRLTRARVMLVRERTLSKYAQALKLGEHLLLGRGESDQGGRSKDSILSDALEAVIGAIYRDGGLDAARRFVLRTMAEDLSRRDRDGGPYAPRNPRTELQEFLQHQRRGTPHYEVVERLGPDHEPSFVAEVGTDDKLLARGTGKSKRLAYEDAARNALSELNGARR